MERLATAGSRLRTYLKRTVRRRTVSLLALVFGLAGLFLLWHQWRLQKHLLELTAVENARAYSDTVRAFRTLYSSEVVSVATDQGILAVHDYHEREGTIPLPATLSMMIGESLRERGRAGRTQLYSPYPFPRREEEGGLQDQFAKDAWDALVTDPDGEFIRIEEFQGQLALRHATADRMQVSCVGCHNNHPDSPKRDWQPGDVRGILEVDIPLDSATAQARTGIGQTLSLLGMFGVAGISGLALVLGRLRQTSDELEQRVQERTEELERREEKHRTILASAHEAFVAIDATSQILEWNQQAEATFGWSQQEAVGRQLPELIIPPRFRDAHMRGLERFMETGEGPALNQRLELSALHRDGHEFPIELSIAAIPQGETYLFSAFVHDITERKQSQQELMRAKEAAEAANRAKSDFLANMSHEIRTPMNAIIGMNELLIDTDLTPTQRDYAAMVQESADSLLVLINDILDFSKIEAGKFQLDASPFDLRECVGDTMKTLAERAHRQGLELAYHIDLDLPERLVGDHNRLRQVIVNLVGNAIKFTKQGEIVLNAECQERTDHDVVVHFTVQDTGIGISSEKQEQIFRAFEQADESTTRQYGGTGLGLAIASRLVNLMEGRIWVESDVGRGSTFHFTARFTLPPDDAKPRGRPSTQSLDDLRVLVVDDNQTNCQILDEILRSWRIQPETRHSGAEALEVLEERRRAGRPFDLVLLDSNMPEMDGLEVADAISRDPELRSIDMIVLTSSDRPEDSERCDSLGIAAYLTKPVKQSELFDAIVLALGDDVAPRHTKPTPLSEVAGQLRPLNILLAEDSVINQTLARAQLEPHGHRVVVANNGKEALDLAASRDFDLILMDVQMPEMDGFQATRAIREREQETGEHIPIVAMTAHALKGDRERCLDAGMDDYVSKPVRLKDLFACLDKLLAGSTLAAQADSVENDRESSPASAPEPVPKDVLNWDTAVEQNGVGAEALMNLAVLFLQDSQNQLAQIQEGIHKGDAVLVHRAAHTLKSSAKLFAAQRAAEAAQRLELIAAEGDLSPADPAHEKLVRELERLQSALAARTENRSEGGG